MIYLKPHLFKQHNLVLLAQTHEADELVNFLYNLKHTTDGVGVVYADIAHNLLEQIGDCAKDYPAASTLVDFRPSGQCHFFTLTLSLREARHLLTLTEEVKFSLRNLIKANARGVGPFDKIHNAPTKLHFYGHLINALTDTVDYLRKQPRYEFKSKSTVHRLLQEAASLKKTKQQRPKVYKLIKAKHRRPFSLRGMHE